MEIEIALSNECTPSRCNSVAFQPSKAESLQTLITRI